MPVMLDATVGGPNANSYLTLAEATAYFDTRLHSSVWEDSEDQEKSLIMATRVLDMMLTPLKYLIRESSGKQYFITRPTWTGTPATLIQHLSWPRAGMFDRNGATIAATAIPQDLKDATAELAFQLLSVDRTLDSDIAVQGITSLKAGSVALSFKDQIEAKVMPDAVWNLMPPSWFTLQLVESAFTAQFEVI